MTELSPDKMRLSNQTTVTNCNFIAILKCIEISCQGLCIRSVNPRYEKLCVLLGSVFVQDKLVLLTFFVRKKFFIQLSSPKAVQSNFEQNLERS